jgi:hypothetical protein
LSPYVSIIRTIFETLYELDIQEIPEEAMIEPSIRYSKIANNRDLLPKSSEIPRYPNHMKNLSPIPPIISIIQDQGKINTTASGTHVPPLHDSEIKRPSDLRLLAIAALQSKSSQLLIQKESTNVFDLFKSKLNIKNTKIFPEKNNTHLDILRNSSSADPFSLLEDKSGFIKKMKTCITKIKEDCTIYLPLLSVFIPEFIPETPTTERIGPDGRTQLLSTLIVKLIDVIAKQTMLAIVIDDAQWMVIK